MQAPQSQGTYAGREALVVFHDLLKRFPGMNRPALKGICGALYPGSVTGLVGPDGAGKSTLMRLLVGLLCPDAGSARVVGFDPASQADRIHPLTGYMPQKFGLYEDLSVMENLRLFADLRGLAGAARQKRFAELLRFTALEPFQSRLAGKLSGGMKQKLGLACALLGEPRILLLDEPSAGVDPISRRELWRMVQALLPGGMAVAWSTSYLDEAERCDAVIVLNEGAVIYDGAPADMLRSVQGKSWEISGIAPQRRRALLMGLLKEGQVKDAVLRGSSIRIVTQRKEQGGAQEAVLGTGPAARECAGRWHPAQPRFEDAFIDMLASMQEGGPVDAFALEGAIVEEKPDSGEAVIEAEALSKRFGDFTAVKNSSFQIRRGEIFGLLGPNGAGKSTIFKMMCGLLQPSSGTARVMGLELKRSSAKARMRIGYMAQKFSLYASLSVLQNLRFFSALYGLFGKIRQERIAMAAKLFGLEACLGMNAENLPPGFKQRLALACAVMHQPDVLFLDEPTSGVDPLTRREFWLHINAMVSKGVTVMVTTHFMDEAEYCDRIALIYRGETIAIGTPEALKEQAGGSGGRGLSLEEAFIALVEQSEARHEKNTMHEHEQVKENGP